MFDAPSTPVDTRPGLTPRAPRKNVMLAASISANALSAPVRIRNLSDDGAMIDGPALPSPGSTLMLNRLELSVMATVVWNQSGRCGLSLAAPIAVDDWIAGVRTITRNASLGQMRVDGIQSAIRSGAALPSENSVPRSDASEAEPIERRVAAEMARVKTMLDKVSDELTDDVDVLMRHERAVQNFDIAAMIIEELATVLGARDPERAVDAVQMHDLRSRLSGRPTLT